MKIIWSMVLEIWSATDRIFSHFGPFFAFLTHKQPRKSKILKNEKNARRYHHFTQVYHKWQSYDVWFLRYEARQTESFVILGHFLPFNPTNNLKHQNFEKIKKALGDNIILHQCTKNHDHMLYCFWDMACNGCNCYFSFWAIFYPFTFQTAWKIKIKKKWKKHLEISFYICVPKIMIR